ncbi:MAG: KH domain-containing protein, partial [Thermodesulfobacteriota bacterium]|nr:KH domain-containing protein [Thermodesulfobacteriota bacterium]
MDESEYTGKTLEEAIANAEIILKEKRENLIIDVVDSKLTSFLNLVGLGKIRIKVTRKENEDGMLRAKRVTEEIIDKMKIEAIVNTEEDDDGIKIIIKGDGSGILIGRYGRTIEALQHIVDKIINKSGNEKKKIVVDVEGYKDRRIESLKKLISKQVTKAKRIG